MRWGCALAAATYLPIRIGLKRFSQPLNVPAMIATTLTASESARLAFGDGAIYAGLIYPIAPSLAAVAIGGLLIGETKDRKIDSAQAAAALAWPGALDYGRMRACPEPKPDTSS